MRQDYIQINKDLNGVIHYNLCCSSTALKSSQIKQTTYHWFNPPPNPLDKMAAFSQTIYSDAFSRNNFFFIFDKILLKFVPEGSNQQ